MVYHVHITTKTTAMLTIGQYEWLVLVQLVCCILVRLMSQYAIAMLEEFGLSTSVNIIYVSLYACLFLSLLV